MQFIVSPVQQNSVSFPGLDPNKRYVIAASNSGHVLTVRSDGVYLEQRKWSENAAQQWRIEKISGTNYYKITSVASGKVLDVQGGSTSDLAKLCVWSWGAGNNQQFELIYLGASKFRIQARHSGKVLDVEGGGGAEGASIIQYSWQGGPNQQFRISELLDISTGATFNSTVTVYEHGSYGGVSKQLGLGSYDVGELGIPNDSLSSMRIPPGVRVTLYEYANFRGRTKVFTSDTPWVGDDFNDLTSAILIDLVATVYEHGSYQGRSQALGVGNYPMSALTIGNDSISSIKVPPGMQVILFEHEFSGARKVVTSDIPFLSDFNETTSSIQVKMVGVVIPDDAIRFGGELVLRSVHNKFLTANTAGSVRNDATTVTDEAKFTVVRAGSVANGTYLSYGDVIALETSASLHVGLSGAGLAATGDPTNGKPAVCAMGAGKIHMFARGPNRSAWWRMLDKHWGAWTDLGGDIIGAPAAVSWGTNHVAMVARGSDNAVWSRTWNGSSWTEWARIGGNITSAPAICSWGPGRLDVFARGADGTLAHVWFANNAWSGWESLGGGIVGAPAAVCWGSNRIDVVVRGTDNACWIRSWVGTSWPTWSSLGGVLSDEPTIASWGSGRLDVFVRNAGGGVSHRAFAGGWGGWEDLGGTIQGGPAACSWGPNRVDVFARGVNSNIWHRRWDAAWSNWADLGGAIDDKEKFVVVRAGGSESRTFVAKGDVIALRHIGNTYVYAHENGSLVSNSTQLGNWEKLTIADTIPMTDAELEAAKEEEPVTCGLQACGAQAGLADIGCGADYCGAQAFGAFFCAADACGAALCGAQASAIQACGAAVWGIALCGADAAGLLLCGAEAAGVTACGANACGAALCGAAGCGADACGTAGCAVAACGAAGCGAAACGAAGCPVDACGAQGCGGDACAVALGAACPIDACGANACAIDICPADACAADACAIDLIPIIPGI